jgi:amino acid transporter
MVMNEQQTAKQDHTLEKYGYEQTLKRVLPLKSLVFYGLAYMMPLTIFTSYGIVQEITHGMLAFAYVICTIAMVFTGLSYMRMVQKYPIAGSVYSYAQRSINPHVGFMGGWAILMDYLLMPILCYVAAAIYLQTILPSLPTVGIVIFLIIAISCVSFVGIKMTSLVNNGLVLIQLVFLVAFLFFIFDWIGKGNGAGTFVSVDAFFNSYEFDKDGVGVAALFAGASILAISFLGFDAVTTVAEEAIEPEKNVGRAIVIICVGAGTLFVVQSYLYQLAWPEGWSVFMDVDSAAFELVEMIAGGAMSYIFSAVYVIGCIGTALASQTSATRILFGMGRDGALPKFFSHVNKRFKTPSYNILLLAVLSLPATFISLDFIISIINFGALTGFILVNLSVIGCYFVKMKLRSGVGNIVKYLLLPMAGAIFCASIWISLDSHSKTLGFIWLGVGLVYLAISTNFFRKLPPDLKLED